MSRIRKKKLTKVQLFLSLTYLLFLKERGFLDTSLSRASKPVLPTLHVRLKSRNALSRLTLSYHKAVLEGRGLYPILSVNS
jgi:hypothetical protein